MLIAKIFMRVNKSKGKSISFASGQTASALNGPQSELDTALGTVTFKGTSI